MSKNLIEDLKEMNESYVYLEGEVCIQENTDNYKNPNRLEISDDIQEFIDSSYVIGVNSQRYDFPSIVNEDIKFLIENNDIVDTGYYNLSFLYKLCENNHDESMPPDEFSLDEVSVIFVESIKSRKRRDRIDTILSTDILENIFSINN